MQLDVHLCEACPTCRSRSYEVARSRYIGSGELTIGYLVRVWSCSLCKREWEDEALAELNAPQERSARQAHGDAANPPHATGTETHAGCDVRAGKLTPEYWLERAG